MSTQRQPNKDLRSAIFAADDRKLKSTVIEEWGVTVYLKPLDYRQRMKLMETVKPKHQENAPVTPEVAQTFTLSLIIHGVCDENGTPIFTDADKEQLLGRNSAVLDRLSTELGTLSGFGPEFREELRERFRGK